MARPLIALVGRPNVGKSTLFNRLAGRRKAIVEDVPGVTRDRNYADVEWDGRALAVVDTGGFEPDTRDPLMSRVRQQAQLAVDEAECPVVGTFHTYFDYSVGYTFGRRYFQRRLLTGRLHAAAVDHADHAL